MIAGAIAAALASAAGAGTDWAATLRQDAQAFHDRIAADHPGMVNRLDPGFAMRNDAGLRRALDRAERVRDYPGYYFAMRGYVASFDDGHVQFSTLKGSPLLTARWPGFLTGIDGRGRQRVRTRADDAAVPLGAELVGCDGVPAARLLATNVGAFAAHWQLEATRIARAGRLFVDNGNPFIMRPVRCRFRVDGRVRNVALAWRPLVDPEWTRRLDATTATGDAPAGMRTLGDGTRWYGMPSFNGDPQGAAAKALRPVIADMAGNRAALLRAPRIVLDVRGNGGGSSLWSVDMAKQLWGAPAVAAVEERATYVEWRASAANLAQLEAYRDGWAKDPSASPEALAWARKASVGMAAARAAGRPLWREPDEPPAASADAPAIAPLRTPVYVLTDGDCASACLDAVDLWTALGAIQVGQQTSADTLYMEVGDGPLPSGIAEAGIPMKVYRGRRRGSNVPATPRYRYAGDMRDTAALERWIATLPR